MTLKRCLFILFFLFAGLGLALENPTSSFAEESSPRLLAKGKYFDIYGGQGTDVYSIIKRLDFSSIRPEYVVGKNGQDLREMLAEIVDTIFLETSDILDIHVYTFKAQIHFLESQQDISAMLFKLVRQSIRESSFYFPENKTIYISAQDIDLGILGHEIAHAIINHYFVVPIPEKAQEVLSGYVEYNLKKKSKKLFKAPTP